MGETVLTLQGVIEKLDYSAITENVLVAISASAAFVIGMIAIKKGYAFLKRQIKGA